LNEHKAKIPGDVATKVKEAIQKVNAAMGTDDVEKLK